MHTDMDFGYVCTVTLTLEIWTLVKVMAHPWVMDNNCVIYWNIIQISRRTFKLVRSINGPDTMWSCEQNRRTGWFL